MARARKHTLLSLDRFARILGVNPVHFNGASGDVIWTRAGSCDETWVQHAWQSMRNISREELADTIAASEKEIAKYLGWDCAPTWHLGERHQWPGPYDRTERRIHYDVRYNQPGIHLNRGKVISGGRRAVTAVELAASPVYSDTDADLWADTCTVTSATALTDASEIKLFFAGKGGHPAWEIRPTRSVTLSGGNVIIVADPWLLIDPDLWEAYPTQAEKPDIIINDTTNYVTEVDVYRVYNDVSQVSSQLRYRSSCLLCDGSGCAACEAATTDGCMSVLDRDKGIVQPKPASYTDGAWVAAAWPTETRPEEVSFWYYSGDISEDYLAGFDDDKLSDYWAQAIAWLTAARLTGPVCSCANVVRMVNQMQTDMLLNKRETGARFIPGVSYVHNNPFGFKYGEVRAWLRVQEAMRGEGGIG